MVDPCELALDQVGQCKFVEEDVEELVTGQREDEFVQPPAIAAGLATAGATATATDGAIDFVALGKAVVAGVDAVPHAAPAMGELRLLDVLAGNADLLAIVEIAHATLADGIRHGLADLPLETLDETRAIDRTLVLAVEAAIYDAYRHVSLARLLPRW